MRENKISFFVLSLCLFFLATPVISAETSPLAEEDWFNPVEVGEFITFFNELE